MRSRARCAKFGAASVTCDSSGTLGRLDHIVFVVFCYFVLPELRGYPPPAAVAFRRKLWNCSGSTTEEPVRLRWVCFGRKEEKR